ncbi:uncharacterized protein LOC131077931 isoform X2 [Cryptomeria japonica]|uniref:uncharacterized protein LOC131077931 isoform X2 n=1 Tax=Cryptomeria japonica TaxID=3369 RepID=UPI0025AC8940|nr:uncharacterized protein LOC131077931 isoform X2 [Cryptomeria japonica]
MATSSSLSEYLKKYTSEGKPKSIKKKKSKPSVNVGGVRIVDEDPAWQAEIKDDSTHEDSPDERPQVTEDIEVKRMKRMEELKMHRPYLTVADDGSGWRTVSQPNKPELQSDDFILKEQGSTDPPNNSELPSAHLNSLSSLPNKNHGSVHQRDITEKSSNHELDDFSSELTVNDSSFLAQKKVQHDSLDISAPQKAWTESPDLLPSRERQRDFGSLHPLPQKKVRHDSPDQSPRQKFSTKSPDLSPPRRRQKDVNLDRLAQMKFQNDSPDQSPRRKFSTMSPDLSPPRRHQKDANSDRLAQMKFQNDSPDQSPRRKFSTKSPDLSPPRRHQKDVGFPGPVSQMKVRHDSPDLYRTQKIPNKSPDLSPPRKRQKDVGSLDCPPQMNLRHDSPDELPQQKVWTKPVDLSPPRRRQKNVGLSDSFPLSKTRHDSPDGKDSSFQHHSHARNAHVKDLDFSPPRRIRHNSSRRDGDSPTKRQTVPSSGTAHETLSERHVMNKTKSKEIMGDGTSAGLRTGKDLKVETDQKKREETQRFSKMDSSLTGRGAETIYRDKRGKRLGREEFLQLQEGQPKPEATPLEWGKGLAQKREAEAKQAELELEKNKPFARSRDDPELDKMLKERVRWGDPMAHLVKALKRGHSRGKMKSRLQKQRLIFGLLLICNKL